MRHKVAISSPKSMVGHLLGAAGADQRAHRHRRHPRERHPTDDQPREPRSARVRPRLRAADRSRADAGRHGHHQRLRLRRPERRHGLPSLRSLTRTRAHRTPTRRSHLPHRSPPMLRVIKATRHASKGDHKMRFGFIGFLLFALLHRRRRGGGLQRGALERRGRGRTHRGSRGRLPAGRASPPSGRSSGSSSCS